MALVVLEPAEQLAIFNECTLVNYQSQLPAGMIGCPSYGGLIATYVLSKFDMQALGSL